jgi:type III pantothenate kinase
MAAKGKGRRKAARSAPRRTRGDARVGAGEGTRRGARDPRIVLVIDAGNTETVLGLFRGEWLLGSWRIASDRARTADECRLLLGLVAREAEIAIGEIAGVSIGSVVPPITAAFREVAESRLRAPTVVVSGETDSGIAVRTDNPREVGADRIANAVAAYRLYGAPAVIVDLGTATTFDVVTARGEYIGGAIAPGILTSSEELFRRAARLTAVDLAFPERVIGRNTVESLRSGILFGAVDQIDGILDRIRAEWGRTFRVLATGGLAGLVAPRSRRIEKVVPDLTLQGLRLIWERAAARRGFFLPPAGQARRAGPSSSDRGEVRGERSVRPAGGRKELRPASFGKRSGRIGK